MAYGKEFSEFESVKIFRTNVIGNGHLPKGSVIVLREKRLFIGEFTVVSYHYLKKEPKTPYERELYNLLSYPVTMSTNPVNELTKGHINFTGFKIYDPPVPISVLGKKIQVRANYQKLTYEEYQRIRGQWR